MYWRGYLQQTSDPSIPYINEKSRSKLHSNQPPTAVQRLISKILENEHPKQLAGSCRLPYAHCQSIRQMKPPRCNIVGVWKRKRFGPVQSKGLRIKIWMLAADDIPDRCVVILTLQLSACNPIIFDRHSPAGL